MRRGSECVSAQRALRTLERNFKLADTEPDAAALVRRLELVSWYAVDLDDDCCDSGFVVDDTAADIACHEQIIRRCPALTHIRLHYTVVPRYGQQALLDALAGKTLLRSVVAHVQHVAPWEGPVGFFTFPELLRMLCESWPGLRTLELTGHAIARRDNTGTSDVTNVANVAHHRPLALQSLILGGSDSLDTRADYALDERDLLALRRLPLHHLTTVHLTVLTNARTMAGLQRCLDAWAPTLERLRISGGKFLSPNDCTDVHVNNACPFLVEGPRIGHLTRLRELELVRILLPAARDSGSESLRGLTRLEKLTVTIDEKRYAGLRSLLQQDCLPSLEYLIVWNFLMRSVDVRELFGICVRKKLSFTLDNMYYSW